MKNSWIENLNDENMLYCLLYTYKFLVLKNTKISISDGISKFHLWADFGKFRQFWAVFGRFCCCDCGCQHAPILAEILETS
jgi:hypothetical protein